MQCDATTCCKNKAKSRPNDSSRKKRRIDTDSDDSEEEVLPESKRKQLSKPKRPHVAKEPTTNAIENKSSSTKNIQPPVQSSQPDGIECTPDLFDFLNIHNYQQTQSPPETNTQVPGVSLPKSVTLTKKTVNSGPPPLVIRNVQGGQPMPPATSQIARAQQLRQLIQQKPQPLRPSNIPTSQISNNINSQQAMRPTIRRPGPAGARSTAPNTNTVVVTASTPSTSSPIYHVINGYRVDLNSASQQNTIRLPNGKIIQVKKQAALPGNANQNVRPIINRAQPQPRLPPPPLQQTQPMPVLSFPNVSAAGQQYVIQSIQSQPRMSAPYTIQGQQPIMQSLPPNILNGMTLQQAQQQLQLQQQQLLKKYPSTPVGNAQTQLEKQIYNGQEICRHIVGKLNTLMNSNAYKNVRNITDIKELYIHLSYLLSYTIGRFNTMQEKCIEDMRKLGFGKDADSLKKGNFIDKYGSDCDEDEIEVVAPKHDTINLDSDDESSTTPVKKSPRGVTIISKNTINATAKETTVENIVEKNIENNVENHDDDELDITMLLEPQIIMESGDDTNNEIVTTPTKVTHDIDIATDEKLNSVVKIKLHRVENKYPEFRKKLKELTSDKSDDDKIDSGQSSETDIDATLNTLKELAGELSENENTETTEKQAEEAIVLDDTVEAVETKESDLASKEKNLASKNNVNKEDTPMEVSIIEINESSEKNQSEGDIELVELNTTTDKESEDSIVDKSENQLNDEEKMDTSEIVNPTEETSVNENTSDKDTSDAISIQNSTDNVENDDEKTDEKETEEKDTEVDGNKPADEISEVDKIVEEIINEEKQKQTDEKGETEGETSLLDKLLAERSDTEEEHTNENCLQTPLTETVDDFENISSPDNFEDYSKNGVPAKNIDEDLDAIDDLLNSGNFANAINDIN